MIPSVLSFALSGIYTIVNGFFVGNSIGDLGLSAVNIAYPIVAVIQGIGMGYGDRTGHYDADRARLSITQQAIYPEYSRFETRSGVGVDT